MHQKRSLATILVVLLAAVIALAALAGCGSSTTTTTVSPAGGTETTSAPGTTAAAPETTTAPTGGYTFGRSNPVASNQLLIAISYGSDQAAKLLNDDQKSTDANLSPDKQVADLDTFVTMKVNGIISWTLDQGAATAAYSRAQGAGIPVVTENSPGDAINTVMVTEGQLTPNAANDAAKYIADRIPGAKVLVLGGPPVPSILFLTDAFQKAAKAAGLTVLERQDNVQDVSTSAQPIVQNLLTKYPDVQAIWAYNDPSALGASAAVRGAGKDIWQEGKSKGIIIVGLNGAPEAADAIKAGYQTVTYDVDGPSVGAVEVELLDRVASGQMAVADMPKVMLFKFIRYDASNIDQYVTPTSRTVSLGGLDQMLAEPTDPAVLQPYTDFLKAQTQK